MLVTVLDGEGVAQTVIMRGHEAVQGIFGQIVATGLAQILLEENLTRSGWIMQNCGAHTLQVNDMGTATATVDSFSILPGSFFPPCNYPVTPNSVSILGVEGTTYAVREW